MKEFMKKYITSEAAMKTIGKNIERLEGELKRLQGETKKVKDFVLAGFDTDDLFVSMSIKELLTWIDDTL